MTGTAALDIRNSHATNGKRSACNNNANQQRAKHPPVWLVLFLLQHLAEIMHMQTKRLLLLPLDIVCICVCVHVCDSVTIFLVKATRGSVAVE